MSSFMSLYSLGLAFAAMTLGYVAILFMFILMYNHLYSLWYEKNQRKRQEAKLVHPTNYKEDERLPKETPAGYLW